jgi:hypothetical protein
VAWWHGVVAWWLVAWVGGMMAYYSGSCIFVLRNAYPAQSWAKYSDMAITKYKLQLPVKSAITM